MSRMSEVEKTDRNKYDHGCANGGLCKCMRPLQNATSGNPCSQKTKMIGGYNKKYIPESQHAPSFLNDQ